MSERKIIITIDEDGKISAEADHFQGEICIEEIQKLLEGFEEIDDEDRKPEFYEQETRVHSNVTSKGW